MGQSGLSGRLKWVAALLAASLACAAGAQDRPPIDLPELDATPADAPALGYPFHRLRVEFATRHPELPLVESMQRLPLAIDTTGPVLDATADTGATLGQVLEIENGSITAAALNELATALVAELNRRGIVGVLVAPDPSLISPATGEDLRPDGRGDLVIRIWVGLVTELRSVGTGDRFDERPVIDHPAHGRILRLSPAQPWNGAPGPREDLIRREVVENYVYRLNRHPNRRVDIAVAPASDPNAGPDATTLDYLVRESRPWTAYAQISNTGTEQTNEWRQRFGFAHYQLTGRDDTLRLDFVTASFDDSYAGVASYDAPLPGTTLARARVYGTFSDYTASDIGLPGQDLSGTTYTYGGELIATVYQRRSLFLDVFGGVVGKSFEVTNDLAGTTGDTDLLLGTAGVRVEDRRPARSLWAEVAVDWTFDGGDQSELPALGRLRVDDSWARIRWDASASVFLEPLLWPGAWNDASTPGSSTLGHELALIFRGQSALDARLIPQEQGVVGGLYSVRGYPESATAGDTTLIGTLEYRAHLPALLGVSTEPGSFFGQPFRWRRDRAFGSADWDLVLAGFVDIGQTINNDAEAGEFDETLLGAGVGIGLDLRRNLRVRADWGFALSDLDDGTTTSGDSEIHFVATLAY
ncbi:MAG: hypothetical protein ACTS22_04470 [Phycisphaerales bacterium]